ncbi:MAG: T9SS type A sorting domain-containing protein, partial [Nitrososphaerales archaeon]
PIGASWYYNQIIMLEGETYSFFEVTDEIMINGKTCKIISGSCNCSVPGAGGYFYQEGDKIYLYNPESLDSLKILYDFTLVAGDTLTFKGDSLIGGDGKFLIDSVTLMQFGSETLRVQHLTHLNFGIAWGNKIIERIGSNGCMYPQVSFCDPGTGGLRCYEDEQTGLINFQIPLRPCNYTTTAIDDPSLAPVIKLYPNPATHVVHIQSEKPIESLTLFNNLAILVYQHSSIHNTEIEFDVHSLPTGVYHIQFILSDHQIVRRTIVIQK